ncbi:hypothetical protein IEO70_04980 [Bacillus sp. AGMB 02131]|uniref:DUF4871 domain-containing protein n=1 Tax=Peribacillus faecalis TaxID=2772559 RepID=A0A927CYL0_9BACI|nr:hypothetical protein [Peribacillus faecalis]MBD3107714.1 hypothetical protein [Peribacillus faecalis]
MKKIIFVIFLLITLIACTQETWKESEIFESGGYEMIGEEGKIGFIYDSEVTKFYPDKEQKYMWHLWGKERLSGKTAFKVVATSKEKEEIIILEGELGGPNNGADAHTPSMLKLPEPGMWKLDAYVEEELFGTIFVEVHEE